MGVFTRFKDIIGSNINAMLDRAEDPEKMIRLMIQEMEETLVEMKAACASQIADRMRLEREVETTGAMAAKWDQRARLAVEKGRDDLAREALREKQRYEKGREELEGQLARFRQLISSSQDDIARLEEKILSARKKQRLLVQRKVRAERKLHAEQSVRKSAGADAALKFEQYEHTIDRMEAAAELVNPRGPDVASLEEQFSRLEHDGSVEQELEALKERMNQDNGREM